MVTTKNWAYLLGFYRLLKSHYYYSRHIGINFSFIPLVFYETLLDQHNLFFENDNDVKCSCSLNHPLIVIWIPKCGHCGLTIRLFLVNFQSDLSLLDCLWLWISKHWRWEVFFYIVLTKKIKKSWSFFTTQIYYVFSEMWQNSLIFNLYVN